METGTDRTGAGRIFVSTGTRDACLMGVSVGFIVGRRNSYDYYYGCVCSSVCTKGKKILRFRGYIDQGLYVLLIRTDMVENRLMHMFCISSAGRRRVIDR